MLAITVVEAAVLLVVPLTVAAGLLLLTARRRSALVTPADDATADAGTTAAARRHAAIVSALAWCTALVAPPLLLAPTERWAIDATRADPLTAGVLTGLAPASAGLLYLGVHMIGERSWPRPTGSVRRAALVRRTVGDIVPGWLRTVVLAWSGLLVATLVTCGVVATDGRSVTRAWPGGSSSAGPFPGWYYGLPLLVATVAVLAGAIGVLRLVAGRPAVVDAQLAWDLGLRRLSAHRVLRGVQLVIGVTTSGVLAVTAAAVTSIGRSDGADAATGGALMAVVGAALAVLAAVVGVASIVIALIPGQPARTPLVLDAIARAAATAPTAGTAPIAGTAGTDAPGRMPPGGDAGALP